MSVPGYKLRKGMANQAALAEETADNVLYEGMEYEDEDEDEENIPEVSDDEAEVDDADEVEDDDDGGELVEAEADDPEDEGEGMVEIDPETGELVSYLSEEMEKDFLEFQKWLWQRTGLTMELIRERAGGRDDG
jgi:hypothetical protein